MGIPLDIGNVGGIFKTLPFIGYAGAAGQAGYGVATGQPVRGLVGGGLSALGTALQTIGLGGTAATGGTAAPVGVPVAALGLGLQVASDSVGNEAQYRWNQLTGASTNKEIPYGTQSVLNGTPVAWAGKDLGWQRKLPSLQKNSLKIPSTQAPTTLEDTLGIYSANIKY